MARRVRVAELAARPGVGVLVSAAAGFLMSAAYHPVDQGWLAWVAPVPWLVCACLGTSALAAALCTAAFGIAFQATGLTWIAEVTTVGYVFTGVSMGLHFVPVALVARAGRTRLGLPLPLVLPPAWLAAEWARSVYVGGFVWLFAGHSQWRYLEPAQLADLGGTWLVGGVVVFGASALAELVIAWVRPAAAAPSRWWLAAVAVAVTAAGWAYGAWRIATAQLVPGPRIGVVQGNIPQDLKLSAPTFESITEPHVALTRSLARATPRPDVIAWPETMLMGCPFSEAVAGDVVRGLARDAGVPLLVGCTRWERDGTGDEPWRHYNSVVMVRPDGTMGPTYDKRRLVQAGEAIPMRDIFAWLPTLVRNMVGYVPNVTPGTEPVLFDVGGVGIGVMTCNESTFPELARGARARGARIVLNATNDGWFKRSQELEQVVAICCFRAIENRVAVVRAANTGISCMISPLGQVEHRLTVHGEVKEVRGTLCEVAMLDAREPLALTVGEWPAYLSIAWTALIALWAWRRPRNRPTA